MNRDQVREFAKLHGHPEMSDAELDKVARAVEAKHLDDMLAKQAQMVLDPTAPNAPDIPGTSPLNESTLVQPKQAMGVTPFMPGAPGGQVVPQMQQPPTPPPLPAPVTNGQVGQVNQVPSQPMGFGAQATPPIDANQEPLVETAAPANDEGI